MTGPIFAITSLSAFLSPTWLWTTWSTVHSLPALVMTSHYHLTFTIVFMTITIVIMTTTVVIMTIFIVFMTIVIMPTTFVIVIVIMTIAIQIMAMTIVIMTITILISSHLTALALPSNRIASVWVLGGAGALVSTANAISDKYLLKKIISQKIFYLKIKDVRNISTIPWRYWRYWERKPNHHQCQFLSLGIFHLLALVNFFRHHFPELFFTLTSHKESHSPCL